MWGRGWGYKWGMIIAGIDEAGYGPLLGPLVVSATAFEVPGGGLPTEVERLPCLWTMMKGAVAKKGGGGKAGRILIADSKVVHNLTDGDKMLERGVLAMLRCVGEGGGVGNLAGLLEKLGCANHELGGHPWYGRCERAVPRWCDGGDLAIVGNMLRGAMSAAKVSVVSMRTAVVAEGHFNRLVSGTNNKASALVSITLGHLWDLHQRFGERGLVVGVDKQGGRDHYTQLLLRTFPEAQLKVIMEAGEGSSYLVQETGRQTVVHFREKGETHFLPTALASMTCKYLREMLMEAFNGWWGERISGLKPTAGYYQDGMRWLGEVEPHLGRLGVLRGDLVRCR